MLVVCAGTRPEFIKLTPVLRELDKRKIDYLFVNTSQHHDHAMNEQFIEELQLRTPDLRLRHNGTECETLYLTMKNLASETQYLGLDAKDVLMVEGDTTSALACALWASKNKIQVAHVEAGLRSNDPRMPEEYNRRLIDHLSTYCFAPTRRSRRNLERERVLGKVLVTGNTIIDMIDLFLEKAISPHQKGPFILATFHRQENVDNPKVLASFLDVCRQAPLPVIYPMHHRTKLRIEENQLEIPSNLDVRKPLGYFAFLGLLARCTLVLTDSGGIQEEVTHPKIRKPCVVMRESTERQEAEAHGFTKIVGTKKSHVLNAINNYLRYEKVLSLGSPYGNGTASKMIVNALTKDA